MNRFIPELTKDEADILAEYTTERKVPQGTILHGYRFTKDLYFVKHGKIEIFNRIWLNNKQTTVHINSIEAPQIIGECTFMLEEREDFTLITSAPCVYLELTEDAFERVKKEHPQIALKMLEHAGKLMAERLNSVQQRIISRIEGDTSHCSSLAMKLMNKFVGSTVRCSRELEAKLFKNQGRKDNKIKEDDIQRDIKSAT